MSQSYFYFLVKFTLSTLRGQTPILDKRSLNDYPGKRPSHRRKKGGKRGRAVRWLRLATLSEAPDFDCGVTSTDLKISDF